MRTTRPRSDSLEGPRSAPLGRAAALLATCALAATACSSLDGSDRERAPQLAPRRESGASKAPDARHAELRARAERMDAHIAALSSDEFEGRAPGSPGEALTVAYLERELRALGLAPGNPDGTFVQDVPLVGITSKGTNAFVAGGKELVFENPSQITLISRRTAPSVAVEASELVFVGHGVSAPEQGWDDFAGLDVRGKTLVFLVGDPPVVDANDPSRLDPAVFGGRAMTYYGRWTYKYEIASKLGAAAAFIVHDTAGAGYGWGVVERSFTRENFDLASDGRGDARVAFEGWLSQEAARALFGACGEDFDALVKSAAVRGFKAKALDAKATLSATNTVRSIASRNVVARLVGSERPREHVAYTAHWDHLGVDRSMPGDGVFNGAVDNASGCAGILDIARQFTERPAPARSILFLFVTAEEYGLLGSRWYSEYPLHPLDDLACAINLDSLNVWGRSVDLVSIGTGSSPELDRELVAIAGERGRVIRGDPEPEKGLFFRSDHFNFLRKGVPAVYADSGVMLIGKPPGAGEALRDAYVKDDYHKPSDERKASWDLTGAVLDMEVLYELGARVAASATWPGFAPTSEFRSRRGTSTK